MSDINKAQVLGLKRYHGKPCRNCFRTEKLTVNGSCVECGKARHRLYSKTKTCRENERARRSTDEYRASRRTDKHRAYARNRFRLRYASDQEFREKCISSQLKYCATTHGMITIIRRKLKHKMTNNLLKLKNIETQLCSN